MPVRKVNYKDDLCKLVPAVLKNGSVGQLESYLTANSKLPGPRMNLELVSTFADVIGQIVTEPDPPVERIEKLLDGWAALSPEEAPANDPREILPAAAALSYGQAVVSRPDWWEGEFAKLRKAASDPRWRMHEMVAAALQRALEADWPRAFDAVADWMQDDDPLVLRAAAAAVAEPSLLTDTTRGMNALSIQAQAISWLIRQPADARRTEAARALRKALGYTVSVAVAAVPEPGFEMMMRLAAMPDRDAKWIVRENLKKARLNPWPEKVEALQKLIE